MAIQISENNLSEKAKKALSNAKNKSQFMRDAIEYYVDSQYPGLLPELLDEIKEVKKIVSSFSLQQQSFSEQAATKEHYQEIKQSEDNIKDTEINSALQDLDNGDDYTSDEKAEIERMLDFSLDQF